MTQYGLSISSPDVNPENLEALDSLHRCHIYNIGRGVCYLYPSNIQQHVPGFADIQMEVLFLQDDVRALKSSL